MKHRLAPALLSRASVLGSAASLLLLAACESGTQERDPLDGLPPAGQLKLQLTRSNSCEELLARIQDGMVVPLAERAKQLRDPQSGYGYGMGGGYVIDDSAPVPPRATAPSGTPVPQADTPVAALPGTAAQGGGTSAGNAGVPNNPVAAPEATNNGTDPGEGPSKGGEFSDTTVQVKDIDEADILKADGDRIYLLHGGTLFVLQGWPASSTSILGSLDVEGEPIEMFVRDGKAVVFSRVYLDGSQLPGATPMTNGYYGYGNTKLTVLDVTAAKPSVLRESYLEGDYVSARRHDGLVRAVVQNGFKVPQIGTPYIEYVDVFGHPYPQEDIDAQVDDWLERTARAVRATEIGDWLPREYSRVNGALVAEQPRCADYYSPDPGLTESGVTSVVSLDLDDVSAPFAGATILGRAERVYSNEDAVLVTQTDYRYELVKGSSQQTLIHRFDIEGNGTSYVASGAVAGSIHDQFSLDERNGVIRVSTTEQNFGGPIALPTQPVPGTSAVQPAPDGAAAVDPGFAMPTPTRPSGGPVNRVVTLGTEGDSLVQLGSTEDFGTNEQIYSTRFIGDLGYVVTFRQTDPLFVIDLADPKHPAVVGELKVPGYSSFLFPFGDDQLLSIGQDASPQGQVTGLSLSLFDVSNPANPTLAQRFTFPESGASPANILHHAISFHQDGNVLAFPYRRNDTGESTLEVFRVSAEQGFTRLGGISEPVDFQRCLVDTYGYSNAQAADVAVQNDPAWRQQILASCSWSREFRRGLFRDDIVYGISNTGVYAYNFQAMADGAVGTVSLPPLTYSYATPGGSIGIGKNQPTPESTPPSMTAPGGPLPSSASDDGATPNGTDPTAP